MIPLAQYLSEGQGEEFVPLRPVERRPLASGLALSAPSVRPLRPHASPAASVIPVVAIGSAAPAPVVDPRLAWEEERRLEDERRERARLESQAERERALRAEWEAAAELQRAAERTESEARRADALAAERARWTEEESDRLADLMILQMAVFEDAMRATVRNVLKPLAIDARQRRALEDLADAVRVIAPEGGEFKLSATGPGDLLRRFREKLGTKADRLVVRADEGMADIRVESDATTIETRLEAWGRAVEKALS